MIGLYVKQVNMRVNMSDSRSLPMNICIVKLFFELSVKIFLTFGSFEGRVCLSIIKPFYQLMLDKHIVYTSICMKRI